MGPKRRNSTGKKAAAARPEPTAEELAELYGNKNFVAPEPAELETIFETESSSGRLSGAAAKRGAVAAGGELALGKNKRQRFLEPTKFWLEDKAKTKHRKQMSNKSFKGKKKLRLVALTPAEEQKLLQVIADQSDSDEEEEQDQAENESPNSPLRLGDPAWRTPGLSSTTPLASIPPSASLRTPSTPLTLGNSVGTPRSAYLPSPSPATGKKRRRSSLLRRGGGFLTNLSQTEDEDSLSSLTANRGSMSHSFDAGRSGDVSPALDEDIRKRIEEADAIFGEIGCTEGQDGGGAEETGERGELRRLGSDSSTLEEEVKHLHATLKDEKKKKKRDSVHVRVRRSSRFFKQGADSGERIGSIFQIAEIPEDKLRGRKSIALNCYGSDDNEEV